MLSTGAALVIAVRSALASHRCSARVPGSGARDRVRWVAHLTGVAPFDDWWTTATGRSELTRLLTGCSSTQGAYRLPQNAGSATGNTCIHIRRVPTLTGATG